MSKKISQMPVVTSLADADLITAIDLSEPDATKNVGITKANLQAGLATTASVSSVAGDLATHAGMTGAAAHAGMLVTADMNSHKSGADQHSIAGVTNLQTELNQKANTADLGDASSLDVGTVAGTVAAGDRPAAVVTAHESIYLHGNLPTAAQKSAMTNAASPSGGNPFATVADLADEGIELKSTGQAAQKILVTDGAGGFGYDDKPVGGATTTFKDLTDTPASYAGQAGLGLRVATNELGLEFYPASGLGEAPADGEIYARKDGAWTLSPVSPVGATATHYLWSVDTVEDSPSVGHAKANNANPTLATKLFINSDTKFSNDASVVWENVQAGDYIGIWEEGTDREDVTYRVTGAITDSGTWFTVPVEHIPGSTGGLDAEQPVTIHVSLNPANRIPVGGSPGQVLGKTGSGDYAVSWQTFDLGTEGDDLKSTGQAAQRMLVTDGANGFVYAAKPAIGTGAKAKDAVGIQGDISFSGVYMYYCYAANSWARTAMETNYAL